MRIYVSIFIIILIILPRPIMGEGDIVPTDIEIRIHQLVNEERKRNGLNELSLQTTMILVARAHSGDMLRNNFFDHTNLRGESPFDRMDNAGLTYEIASENLFFTTGSSDQNVANEAVSGWIDSPGHYANMLSIASYTGIGLASSGDTYYVTQIFIEEDKAQMEKSGEILDNNWEPGIYDFLYRFRAILIISAILVALRLLDKRPRK